MIRRPQPLAKWHNPLLQFLYTLRCHSQNSPLSSILKLLNASLLTNDAIHEQIFSYNALLMQRSLMTVYETEPDEIF